MNNYEMCISTRIIYGPNRHREIGQRLKQYTDKVLLVYGGGSIRRTGLYDSVTSALREADVGWLELGGVKANPVVPKVEEGIALCRKENIRFLLAVGGGSVIDTAKAIACGFYHEGPVWDYYEGKAKVEKALPIATILTVPGTGAEVSVNAILSNEATGEKRGILNDCLRPVFSILDPTLCLTLPRRQIGSGVYDMLCHTLERYLTRTEHTDVVDGVAEGIMKAILRNGPKVMQNPADVDAWGELMLASNYSHNMMTGFGRAADWSCHGMEEVISGVYDIPHGAGLSILMPQWMRYVYKKHLPMFVQFAVNVMGIQGPLRDQEDIAYQAILALEDFSRKMELPLRLAAFGIDDSHFEEMAKTAVSYKANGLVGRLEPLGWEDIVAIYRMCL